MSGMVAMRAPSASRHRRTLADAVRLRHPEAVRYSTRPSRSGENFPVGYISSAARTLRWAPAALQSIPVETFWTEPHESLTQRSPSKDLRKSALGHLNAHGGDHGRT